jgi:hypothetical protein
MSLRITEDYRVEEKNSSKNDRVVDNHTEVQQVIEENP